MSTSVLSNYLMRDKMQGSGEDFNAFLQHVYNKFNNIGAQMFDSFYNLTLKIF